jgi:hypothetical protein
MQILVKNSQLFLRGKPTALLLGCGGRNEDRKAWKMNTEERSEGDKGVEE